MWRNPPQTLNVSTKPTHIKNALIPVWDNGQHTSLLLRCNAHFLGSQVQSPNVPKRRLRAPPLSVRATLSTRTSPHWKRTRPTPTRTRPHWKRTRPTPTRTRPPSAVRAHSTINIIYLSSPLHFFTPFSWNLGLKLPKGGFLLNSGKGSKSTLSLITHHNE